MYCSVQRALRAAVLVALAGCSDDAPATRALVDAGSDATAQANPTTSGDARTVHDSGTFAVARADAGRTLDAASPSVGGPHTADGARPVPSADASAKDAGSAPGALPSDAATPPSAPSGSCFGRCGVEALLSSPTADCRCDVGCLARGDCCQDKHELCAVSASAPVCPLTGSELDRAMCGSDLGWSFSHEGALEIFFGDSYDADCQVPFLYDDAQGRLPLARPSIVPARPPSSPVACGNLLELDKTDPGPGATFSPMRLYEDGVLLSSWLLETPLTGFSDGAHAYMIARRGEQLGAPLYLGVRDPGATPNAGPARSIYRVLQQVPTRHFQNLTATSVKQFDPEAPDQHDYQEGPGALFVWGRDSFSGPSARSLYLAMQTLPLVEREGTPAWAPRYFAGIKEGRASWSSDENDARPVIENDFSLVNQHEVAWIEPLKKWVMLYGGDTADGIDGTPNDSPRHGAIHIRMADDPWGPWTAAAPAFFREHAAPFMHCDAPTGCDLDDLPDDPTHSYSPGAWGDSFRDFSGCRQGSSTPRQPAFTPGSPFPCAGDQRGNLYAPNLLVPWTVDHGAEQGYSRAATLYFNVSTWMPYQVLLAALTVHLP